MPFPNYIGSHKRFWTRENVINGLRLAAKEIHGPLPCCDYAYNQIKKGKLNWPTSHRVLEYFGSMSRGWLEAGCPMKRVSLNNLDWTEDEQEFLLANSGTMTIEKIARKLNRSYGACRKELQKHGVRARDNEGFVSASQLSKELPCSYDRLLRFLNEGKIPGSIFDPVRNRWKIDPFSINPEIEAALRSPRKTHNTWPLDVGDYSRRNGLIRKNLNGKFVRIKESIPC